MVGLVIVWCQGDNPESVQLLVVDNAERLSAQLDRVFECIEFCRC